MILTSVYTCVILTLTKYYFWSLICPMFLRGQQSQQTNTYPTNLNRHDRTTKEKTNVGTRPLGTVNYMRKVLRFQAKILPTNHVNMYAQSVMHNTSLNIFHHLSDELN